MEEGADLPDYTPTPPDQKLSSIYGDHIHNNDGTHMDRGISDDKLWQRLWRRTVNIPPRFYRPPLGQLGKEFVETLADEFAGIRTRRWNSERALIFAPLILNKARGVRCAKDIRLKIKQWLKLWKDRQFEALVFDLESEA